MEFVQVALESVAQEVADHVLVAEAPSLHSSHLLQPPPSTEPDPIALPCPSLFPFDDLVLDLQGEVAARASKIGATFLSLSSRAMLQRLKKYATRTPLLLLEAARDGDMRLFSVIETRFDFPLVTKRIRLNCLVAVLEGGHVAFFSSLIERPEMNEILKSSDKDEDGIGIPSKLVKAMISSPNCVNMVAAHFLKIGNGDEAPSLAAFAPSRRCFEVVSLGPKEKDLLIAMAAATLRRCQVALLRDYFGLGEEWPAVWRYLDGSTAFFGWGSEIADVADIPDDSEETLKLLRELAGSGFRQWLDLFVPIALKKQRVAALRVLLDAEALIRDGDTLIRYFTTPQHEEVFELLLSHPNGLKAGQFDIYSVPNCAAAFSFALKKNLISTKELRASAYMPPEGLIFLRDHNIVPVPHSELMCSAARHGDEKLFFSLLPDAKPDIIKDYSFKSAFQMWDSKGAKIHVRLIKERPEWAEVLRAHGLSVDEGSCDLAYDRFRYYTEHGFYLKAEDIYRWVYANKNIRRDRHTWLGLVRYALCNAAKLGLPVDQIPVPVPSGEEAYELFKTLAVTDGGLKLQLTSYGHFLNPDGSYGPGFTQTEQYY